MLLLRSLTQELYFYNCWISDGTNCRFLHALSPHDWYCLDSLSDKMTLLSCLSLTSPCQPVTALDYQMQHLSHEVFTEVCEILLPMLGMVGSCVSTWPFGLHKLLRCEVWVLLHCFLLFAWKGLSFLCREVTGTRTMWLTTNRTETDEVTLPVRCLSASRKQHLECLLFWMWPALGKLEDVTKAELRKKNFH